MIKASELITRMIYLYTAKYAIILRLFIIPREYILNYIIHRFARDCLSHSETIISFIRLSGLSSVPSSTATTSFNHDQCVIREYRYECLVDDTPADKTLYETTL